MSLEIKRRYLELHNDEDPKQRELAFRILSAYEKADVLGLEIRWPEPPFREKIISFVETNLQFQIESMYSLIEAYRNVDSLKLPFLSSPYTKRNVPKFIKKCDEFRLESAPMDPQLLRKKVWCSYFLAREDDSAVSMALLPKGSFKMGSKEGGMDSNRVHKVQISRDFWMARTPLTQQKYKFLLSKFKKNDIDNSLPESPSKFWGPLRPVDSLSWFDALQLSFSIGESHRGLRSFRSRHHLLPKRSGKDQV